jgi:hypothetical protein
LRYHSSANEYLMPGCRKQAAPYSYWLLAIGGTRTAHEQAKANSQKLKLV